MDDITALQQLSDDAMKTEEQVLDIRPATAWTNDIQRAILVEGAKHFRGQNPPRGAAISYWLKSAPAGGRAHHDQRHHRTRDPLDRGHEGRRPESRAVGSDAGRRRSRRAWRGTRRCAAAPAAAPKPSRRPVLPQRRPRDRLRPVSRPRRRRSPSAARVAEVAAAAAASLPRWLPARIWSRSWSATRVIGQKTLVVEADINAVGHQHGV